MHFLRLPLSSLLSPCRSYFYLFLSPFPCFSLCSFFAGPARLLRGRRRQARVRSSTAAVLSPLRATCNLLPCSLARSLAYSLLSFSARVPGWPGRLVARPGMRYPRCHGPIRTHASGQSVIHNANARGFCPRLALGDQETSKRRRETAAATCSLTRVFPIPWE